MKLFKFNLTPTGIISHVVTILIKLAMVTFVMNVSQNNKVKKLAYLTGYWLDFAQIRLGDFWILGGMFGF